MGERVEPDDLPEELRSTGPTAYAPGKGRLLAEVEREYAVRVLGEVSEETLAQLKQGREQYHR